VWRGGVYWLGRRTCNREVAGSSPGLSALRTTVGKLFTHTHMCLFTKQYNLVPAIGWKGNRRSGVALAMRHRLSDISTYGLGGLRKGDKHPKLLSEYTASLAFTCGYTH